MYFFAVSPISINVAGAYIFLLCDIADKAREPVLESLKDTRPLPDRKYSQHTLPEAVRLTWGVVA